MTRVIGRAWGRLTPFGQALVVWAVVVAASLLALLVGLLADGAARTSAAPSTLPPIVIGTSIEALTTPGPDLGRVESMSVAETDGDRAVISLSRAQVNALASDVSGSPYWAAWASKCWGGEATLVEGGRYLVATLSPTDDYGLTAINAVWRAHGFEPERALRDPRYAVEFAWAEVMPRQGIAAWYGRGCGL